MDVFLISLLREAAELLKQTDPMRNVDRSSKVGDALMLLIASQEPLQISRSVIPIDAADLMSRVADLLQGYADNHRKKDPPQEEKAATNELWSQAILGQLSRYGQALTGWRPIDMCYLPDKEPPFDGKSYVVGWDEHGRWDKVIAYYYHATTQTPFDKIKPGWRVTLGRPLAILPTHWCTVSDMKLPTRYRTNPPRS